MAHSVCLFGSASFTFGDFRGIAEALESEKHRLIGLPYALRRGPTGELPGKSRQSGSANDDQEIRAHSRRAK